MSNPVQLDSWDTFVEATKRVFSSWTALNLAIEQGWGGRPSRDKGQRLMEETVRIFQGKEKIYPDQLEDHFEQFLNEEFNTHCEDGSTKQVSELLVLIHRECKNNNFARVAELAGVGGSTSALGSCIAGGNTQEEDIEEAEDGDDVMEDAEPELPPPPRVDADGWETVTSRRGSRK